MTINIPAPVMIPLERSVFCLSSVYDNVGPFITSFKPPAHPPLTSLPLLYQAEATLTECLVICIDGEETVAAAAIQMRSFFNVAASGGRTFTQDHHEEDPHKSRESVGSPEIVSLDR